MTSNNVPMTFTEVWDCTVDRRSNQIAKGKLFLINNAGLGYQQDLRVV